MPGDCYFFLIILLCHVCYRKQILVENRFYYDETSI